MPVLTALPNVSTPCVTTNPCTCPVYGPGGEYLPIDNAYCQLALIGTPVMIEPAPVHALSSWALAALVLLLTVVGVRRLR